jgi:hypothetical protein
MGSPSLPAVARRKMGQAKRDNVTFLYYPASSKHLEAARKTLPRTDVDVQLNPKIAHSPTGQKTLDSFFS